MATTAAQPGGTNPSRRATPRRRLLGAAGAALSLLAAACGGPSHHLGAAAAAKALCAPIDCNWTTSPVALTPAPAAGKAASSTTLTVAVADLGPTIRGAVNLISPTGRQRTITATTTITAAVAGRWVIDAHPVQHGGYSYFPLHSTTIVNLAGGADATVTVDYAQQVSDTVRVADPAAITTTSSAAGSPTPDHVTVTAAAADIKAGTILVAGVGPATPKGLLVHVNAVHANADGTLTLTTSPAQLSDAVPAGQIDYDEPGPDPAAGLDSAQLSPSPTGPAGNAQLDSVLLSSDQTANGPTHTLSLGKEYSVTYKNGLSCKPDPADESGSSPSGGGTTSSASSSSSSKGGDGPDPEVSASVSFSKSLHIHLKWGGFWHPTTISAASVSLDAQVKATVDTSVSLGEVGCHYATTFPPTKYLDAFTVWAGPIPVVFVPQVTFPFLMTASAALESKIGADASASFDAGIAYSHGHLTRIGDGFSHDQTIKYGPAVTGDANIALTPRLSLLIYGIVGPYIQAGVFANFHADTTLDPWWTTTFGLQGSAGLALPLWHKSWQLPALFQLSWSGPHADGPFALPVPVTTTTVAPTPTLPVPAVPAPTTTAAPPVAAGVVPEAEAVAAEFLGCLYSWQPAVDYTNANARQARCASYVTAGFDSQLAGVGAGPETNADQTTITVGTPTMQLVPDAGPTATFQPFQYTIPTTWTSNGTSSTLVQDGELGVKDTAGGWKVMLVDASGVGGPNQVGPAFAPYNITDPNA